MSNRALGYNENIIINALRTSDPSERIRVQLYMNQGVMGYAIEVVREIMGIEFEYVGWMSMKAFKLEPWPIDQRHMIDRAFALAVKDEIAARGN